MKLVKVFPLLKQACDFRRIDRNPPKDVGGIYASVYRGTNHNYVYIGKTTSFRKRFRVHHKLASGEVLRMDTNKKHENVARKHGDSHRFYMLESITSFRDMHEREMFWIRRVWDELGKDVSLNVRMTPNGGLQTSKILKDLWKDPAFVARQAARLDARWADPKYRAFMGSVAKRKFNDPVFAKKFHDARELLSNDPAFIALKSKRAKKMWQDNPTMCGKQNIITVMLPDQETYRIRQSTLVSVLNMPLKGGVHKAFDTYKVFRDWSLLDVEVNAHWTEKTQCEEFKEHGYIAALSNLKKMDSRIFLQDPIWCRLRSGLTVKSWRLKNILLYSKSRKDPVVEKRNIWTFMEFLMCGSDVVNINGRLQPYPENFSS